MNIKQFKKVHIIGIGGAGTSAIARLLLSQGVAVTGSDLNESQTTSSLIKLGAVVTIGAHKSENVTKGTSAVVFSSAVQETNPERQQAGSMKIPSYDYHEFLGIITDDSESIVVCGTHGKTTTTAMIGAILQNSKLKPTVLVGSQIRDFKNSNVSLGNPKSFVLEGDEYNKGLLYLNPHAVVLTNVEHDHFDTYPNVGDYFRIFEDFIQKLDDEGYFIYNADDRNTVERIERPHCHTASFGMKNSQADLFLKNHKIAHGRQIFKVVYKGNELKDFNIKLPGKYNLYNAMAAMLLALELGVNQDIIKDTMASFVGASRRFELIGNLKGAPVISDYAHHPTALREVVQAVHEFYPDKEIIVYFQPHQKNRTKNLLNEFAEVISALQVKKVILNEIYDVTGRTDENKITSQDIIKKAKSPIAKLEYAPDLETGFAMVKKSVNAESVLLVVGAGDIDAAARNIVEKV